jgi:hypothetical protein
MYTTRSTVVDNQECEDGGTVEDLNQAASNSKDAEETFIIFPDW